MNFVIVKHPKCSQLYLFRLPENIVMSPFIDVMCDTRFGRVEGITVTPSFHVPDKGVDKLCDLYGTRKEDLKFVKSVVETKEISLFDKDALENAAERNGGHLSGIDIETVNRIPNPDEDEDDEDEETPEEKLAALGHMLVHVFGDKEEKK